MKKMFLFISLTNYDTGILSIYVENSKGFQTFLYRRLKLS